MFNGKRIIKPGSVERIEPFGFINNADVVESD